MQVVLLSLELRDDPAPYCAHPLSSLLRENTDGFMSRTISLIHLVISGDSFNNYLLNRSPLTLAACKRDYCWHGRALVLRLRDCYWIWG